VCDFQFVGLQSGYDSRGSVDYHRIPSADRLVGTNAGTLGRWAFHINRVTGKFSFDFYWYTYLADLDYHLLCLQWWLGDRKGTRPVKYCPSNPRIFFLFVGVLALGIENRPVKG